MKTPSAIRFRIVVAALVTLAVSVGGWSASSAQARPPKGNPPAPARPVRPVRPVVTVGSDTVGQPIPPGFLGVSIETPAIASYAGSNPLAINPVFEQLLRNLAPGQSQVLRIGGDSTDWTWYPVPHMKRPPWVRYTLTPNWLAVTRALAEGVNARVIFGVNLEANNPKVAATEANAVINGIGPQSIDALELGNEPELYGSFSWYRTRSGHEVTGRAKKYSFADFTHNFSTIARSLPLVPLAGPSIGSSTWLQHLQPFLNAAPRVGVVTLHRYPLKRCLATAHVSAAQLLSETSSIGLADSVARDVALAHARGHQLRVDEMNSIACGGESGVSNTFASSLWSLDALFAMASVGVDGVNIHTVPNSINELFSFTDIGGQWLGSVRPDYYGLLMFAQAAPPGARLLKLSGTTRGPFRAWATIAPDGHVRVVLINTNAAQAQLVKVRAPAAPVAATLEQLTAPGIAATSGVTLGGQTFVPQTATGLLAGTPLAIPVTPVAGAYQVTLPAASAAILTLG